MLNTFRAYDPSTIQTKSYSTACEQCYARKVKCELLEDKTQCKQCVDHGIECKTRTRKRKATSVDDGKRECDDSVSCIQSPSTSKSRQDTPDTSNGPRRRRLSSSARTTRSLHRSSSVSVPDLFVNREPGVDFSPESAERTDSPLQDRFRNASFLSRSAILGDDFQDIDHAHADRAISEDKVSPIEQRVLRLHGAFELADLPLRQSLIEAYIERCYTWMPVIDLSTFTATPQSPDGSLLLLQAVTLAGSLMRPDVCSKSFCDRQYRKVKALVQSGHERNPLNILAALCLIQWYTPTSPRDISTDVPRFWNTYALGLAQQMGLHRAPTKLLSSNGLRNRIWCTIVARDNLTASAHGRPRIVHPEDCSNLTPTMQDFGDQQGIRAEIFIHYVAITRILGDLCQLITRKGEASADDKRSIALRLCGYMNALPEPLRLYSPSGLAQQYNFELAQLHVPILITVTILFRPRTIFQLTEANAASVTAAFLSFRVFQAIQLREQIRFLSSAFAWHLLVTAIPLLSCTKVDALHEEANEALDAVESVLDTLASVRPAAANNLRNVRAIRKAMMSKPRGAGATATMDDDIQSAKSMHLGPQILQAYGRDAVNQYQQVADVLRAHSNHQAEQSAQAAAHTLSCLSGRQESNGIDNEPLNPAPAAYLPVSAAQDDIQSAFTAVFEDDTLSSSWMMRDWMDELMDELQF